MANTTGAGNHLATLLFLLAVITIAFYLGRCTEEPEVKFRTITQTIVKYDTVLKPSEPIFIRGKSTITYINERDTIIQTKPFTAKLDTIVRQDTFSIMYSYPENDFDLKVWRHPDSAFYRYQVDSVITERVVEEKRSFWERAGEYAIVVVVWEGVKFIVIEGIRALGKK